MSETIRVKRSQRVLTCSACGVEYESKVVEGAFYGFTREAREFDATARALGWSRWVGRGVRWYCPDHEPRPGHSMREDTGR